MLNGEKECGATMVEYALITAFVAVLSVVGFTKLGASEVEAFTSSGDAVVNASDSLKKSDGSKKTFHEIMKEVGHPLAAAGGCSDGNACGGETGGGPGE